MSGRWFACSWRAAWTVRTLWPRHKQPPRKRRSLKPKPAVEEAAQPAGTPVVGAASPLAAGARVVTSIDVNLRAEPAEDAEVVTILGEGVELEVTGAPVDGWVPVTEPGTGQAGFVSDQFVTLVHLAAQYSPKRERREAGPMGRPPAVSRRSRATSSAGAGVPHHFELRLL